MRALLLAAFSLLLTSTHAAAAAPQLMPKYKAKSCTVSGNPFDLEEISFIPSQSGLELRAALNSLARPNGDCAGGYGGPDLSKLISKPDWTPGFRVVGAVNGTVFREQARKYVSNQFLWSANGGLLAPLRRSGGKHLFVADVRGGRNIVLNFVTCTPQNITCAELAFPGDPKRTRPLTSQALIRELQKRFPTMSLALQSNMPLMDSKIERGGRFTHWSQCPEKKPGDWRCANQPRTILCAKRGGDLSLITTPAAYPFDLARGLRRGGECKVDCDLFYNLDGGGSTQMAHLKASDEGSASYEFTGRRIETTQEQCSSYRPVDNYLLVVKPR